MTPGGSCVQSIFQTVTLLEVQVITYNGICPQWNHIVCQNSLVTFRQWLLGDASYECKAAQCCATFLFVHMKGVYVWTLLWLGNSCYVISFTLCYRSHYFDIFVTSFSQWCLLSDNIVIITLWGHGIMWCQFRTRPLKTQLQHRCKRGCGCESLALFTS